MPDAPKVCATISDQTGSGLVVKLLPGGSGGFLAGIAQTVAEYDDVAEVLAPGVTGETKDENKNAEQMNMTKHGMVFFVFRTTPIRLIRHQPRGPVWSDLNGRRGIHSDPLLSKYGAPETI